MFVGIDFGTSNSPLVFTREKNFNYLNWTNATQKLGFKLSRALETAKINLSRNFFREFNFNEDGIVFDRDDTTVSFTTIVGGLAVKGYELSTS